MTINHNIKLKVPLIQQQKGSYHCQIATCLMIMEFYGDKIPYEELVEKMGPYLLETGMDREGISTFLVKRGYDVLSMHRDLNVIDNSIENSTEKDLEKLKTALQELPINEVNKYQREKLALDIEYIKAGGKLSYSLANLETIDSYLGKNIPVVLGVRNNALHLNPGNKNNHSIVVIGKENNDYILNDPSPKTQGEYKVNKDILLQAWYSNSAYILIVMGRDHESEKGATPAVL